MLHKLPTVRLYTWRIPLRGDLVHVHYKYERFKDGKTAIGRKTNLKWQFSGQLRTLGRAVSWYVAR